MLLLSGEATHTNFIVFGFTQPKMEYTIYCNRCEHANPYNNEMGFLKGRITLREHLSSTQFLVGSELLIFLVFCVSFRSEFRVVMSVMISASKRCSVPLYLLLFVRGPMSYLHFSFVWCPTHIMLCSCFVFLHLVYTILPVSLDCQILIAPSLFFNVYFITFYVHEKGLNKTILQMIKEVSVIV